MFNFQRFISDFVFSNPVKCITENEKGTTGKREKQGKNKDSLGFGR